MNDEPEFRWPEDLSECSRLARSMLIEECVSKFRYWVEFGTDLLTNPQPAEPYIRSHSGLAKRDRAYREAFSTLSGSQRVKVVELLSQCVQGAVFSTLCTFDQFPHGEAEISVRDDVCGAGERSFRIDTDIELHEDFSAAVHSHESPDKKTNA
jgi:hypothetical protein